MGLVPPFGWKDVETFEGDVACTGILLSMSFRGNICSVLASTERARLIFNQTKIFLKMHSIYHLGFSIFNIREIYFNND